jgi:hypothetical protein
MIEEFYKRKLIRDFLSLFSEVKWKELLFILVEYAIVMLKRNYNIASLSVDDIIAVLDDLKEEDSRRFRQSMRERENKKNVEIVSETEKPNSDWRKGINKVIIVKKEAVNIKKQTIKKKDIYPEWWEDNKTEKPEKHVYYV